MWVEEDGASAFRGGRAGGQHEGQVPGMRYQVRPTGREGRRRSQAGKHERRAAPHAGIP